MNPYEGMCSGQLLRTIDSFLNYFEARLSEDWITQASFYPHPVDYLSSMGEGMHDLNERWSFCVEKNLLPLSKITEYKDKLEKCESYLNWMSSVLID